MFKFLFDRDTWQELSGSLKKNKLRSVLTMVGVWWGVLLLIGLLGSAKGMENSFNRLFSDFATNSVFISGGTTSKPFKGYQEGRSIRLTTSDCEKIKDHIEGVEFVLPRNRNRNQATRNFLTGSFSIVGDYPLLNEVKKVTLLNGRFINQNDIKSKNKIAVISERVYTQLFKEKEEVIGAYITLNDINFKVVGMFKRDNGPGPEFDIHIPFTTYQKIYNQGDNIGWVMVTAKPEFDITQVEADVKLLLKNIHKVHPNDKRAFGGFNLGERISEMTGFLKGMQFLTWFVGIATLIAGVFAIGNILLITVKERTKEIGIRRALGAKPFEIKRQIVIEALFLALIAGIFGIISGGWILILMDSLFGQGDDAVIVNASVSIAIVFLALLILVVLGTLIGLIPANKATSVKPIDALREE